MASTLSYLLTTSKTNLLFGMIGNLPPRGIVFNRPATLDSSLDSHSECVCVIYWSRLEHKVFESIEITFKSVLARRHLKAVIKRLETWKRDKTKILNTTTKRRNEATFAQ